VFNGIDAGPDGALCRLRAVRMGCGQVY